MTIRKMNIGDYKNTYDLWLSCKGMGLNDVDDSEGGIARFLERNPETCFVAEENGGLIGVILAGNDGGVDIYTIRRCIPLAGNGVSGRHLYNLFSKHWNSSTSAKRHWSCFKKMRTEMLFGRSKALR